MTMTMKRARFNLIILVALLCCFCFYCSKKTPSEQDAKPGEKLAEAVPADDGKIILQINEKQFSNKDFKQFLKDQYPNMSENLDEVISPRLLSRIFDSFVEHKIILYAAEKEEIPVNQKEFADYLEKLKITPGDIDKTAITDAVKVQKFLYYKVYNNIEVSDKEIDEHYRQHIDEFRKQPEVLLYQILVKDREAAVKIRGILKNAPRKFEEIAREQSISMEASKGGLMGYFEKGTLPKDMEDVVFSLSIDTISPVVESSYGFHIFKITEKKKERLLYLDKVKPEIKNKLLSEKLREAYREFLAQAKTSLKIDISPEDLYFEYQPLNNNNENEKKEGEGDESKETITPGNTGHPGR
jgi:parvulin-like peptidyl-prolyl isomerase